MQSEFSLQEKLSLKSIFSLEANFLFRTFVVLINRVR